jgi:Inorganic Pyrophosphatase
MNLALQLDLTATGRPLQGRIEFQGLLISVENAAGSVRKGYKPDGTMWKTKMKVPYGYIRKTMGVDGDHVDCFVGANRDAPEVYIITINKPPDFKKPDEQKCMLGFNSAHDAKETFFKHYDNKKFFRNMVTMSIDDFKKKVLDTKDNPQQLKAYSTAIGPSQLVHMDVTQTFHPPSLKNPDKVPADQPGETNDRFGDVTKRKSREVERLRRDQTGHSSPLPSFPGALTTNVQSLTGEGLEAGGPGSGRHKEMYKEAGIEMPKINYTVKHKSQYEGEVNVEFNTNKGQHFQRGENMKDAKDKFFTKYLEDEIRKQSK